MPMLDLKFWVMNTSGNVWTPSANRPGEKQKKYSNEWLGEAIGCRKL